MNDSAQLANYIVVPISELFSSLLEAAPHSSTNPA